MKKSLKLPVIALLVITITGFSSFIGVPGTNNPKFKFPYKKAGLTERQAAAHLLSRFTYGATPGQIDAAVKMGLENWFEQQLSMSLPDDSLKQLLSSYDALQLSNAEIVKTYPRPGEILRMAVKDGLIDKDSVNKAADKQEYRAQLQGYLQQKGMKPQQELFRQFFNQKILRAAYSNNQLQEILTDFWFNHFNVSITKNDCAEFIPVYERDVIRPNVLGKFEDLLLATAKSPAMLLYLDNFISSGNDIAQNPRINANNVKPRQAQGLNENYAREVMELHTLSVDGGYTQKDVTEAARVLTGWTIYPLNDYGGGQNIRKIIDRVGEDKLEERGFIHQGDFLFAANRHDKNEKTVLGKTFKANGGYEEGMELLKMLAHHASTAKFISKKLATRFVSDNPPQSLLDKMTKTFTDKDGDIREVLITMVSSPEFWEPAALREKTKSPFELAISSVRSLNATIRQPFQLYNWINKMGQKMYYYQAPTGFPDNGKYWINTGALLNRMNFGLALASNRIPGITVDLLKLNNNHEPESTEAALLTFSKMVMPERNLDETIKRLTPMLNDPELGKKVDEAAGKTAPPVEMNLPTNEDEMTMDKTQDDKKPKNKPGKKNNPFDTTMLAGNNTMLSQVVGIIIGSPEFQRK